MHPQRPSWGVLRMARAAVLGLLCTVLPWGAWAEGFEACREQFFAGFVPRLLQLPSDRLQALCFDGFAVLHSGQSKGPVYVAQHLDPARLKEARGIPRSNIFYEEARLPSADRATLDDYQGAGYDRGHMAPAADMPNPNANAQSFSLANMVPQSPEHNRGPWAKSVEQATRHYVERGNAVYVLTGPLHGQPARTIGTGQVWVPEALFKLVYDPARRRAWAYILPNHDQARVEGTYSYAELVRRTGIELLPAGAVEE